MKTEESYKTKKNNDMDTELIAQKLRTLPEILQIQVFDYIEFLINKYQASVNYSDEAEILNIEKKQILEDCWNNYLKFPHKVKTWEQVENEIIQENGYAI